MDPYENNPQIPNDGAEAQQPQQPQYQPQQPQYQPQQPQYQPQQPQYQPQQPQYQPQQPQQPKKKGGKWKIILPIVLVLVAALAVGAYFLFLRGTPVKAIRLEDADLQLSEGDSYTLNYRIQPEDATELELTWKSSDKSVVTVKDGKLLAVGAGECTVTVTAESGASDSVNITVLQPIFGTWSTTIDISDILNEELSLSLGMDVDIDTGMQMSFDLTLNEDMTYTAHCNTDALADEFDTYMAAVGTWLTEALYQQMEAEGMTREEIDAAFAAEGLGSLSVYINLIIGQFDADELLSEADFEDVTGVFKFDEEKLWLAENEADLEDDYLTYTLEGDELHITELSGDNEFFEQYTDFFPIVFTRG